MRPSGRLTIAGVALAFGICLAAPMGLAAQQQTPDTTAAKKPAKPPELVFEREVFTYPSVARRNPFAPLAGTEQGPRFDQLRLMGIMYDANHPSASMAMIGTSTVQTSADSTQVTVSPQGQAWYLKVGQAVGSIRVVEIRQDAVVVEVAQFGITERKVMRMESPGGTQ
ncbi:MAG: hypothetical protein LJF04_11790 [Gemmatimonadetes bacterium]|nr:hypothetical protein [Gemmatimonadota bacterium]